MAALTSGTLPRGAGFHRGTLKCRLPSGYRPWSVFNPPPISFCSCISSAPFSKRTAEGLKLILAMVCIHLFCSLHDLKPS
ncbi:hypothetical protein GOP47_0016890 [Adiantum capillus-veneris]|uniref:Uncharacterized protein n=1 Tax=Adiantum capillus-veneris TaxID=13818 RepID=A0A9D4ZCJ0_ADICA|nr:hypothetical protein GOP47_0016890 [Adiantum capillus-veneris]